MPKEYSDLEDKIVALTKLAACPLSKDQIEIKYLPVPHKRPSSLPKDTQAVYCFFHETTCLKVGKAGPKSGPRFTSHHYYCKAPSTLAKSILGGKSRMLTLLKQEFHEEFLALDEQTIGPWIEKHTARLNVLIPAAAGPHVLSLIEAFLQCQMNPLFEGGNQ